MSDTGMTTTSSFRSTTAALWFVAARSLPVWVVAIAASVCSSLPSDGSRHILQRHLPGQCLQGFAEHPVEGRERMDDVDQRRQRNAQLDREHQLADDLAGTRGDEGRADQHAALAIADEFQ